MKSRLNQLEAAHSSLKLKYEEEIIQSEVTRKELEDTIDSLVNVRSKLLEVELSIKSSKASKKQLELKHKSEKS